LNAEVDRYLLLSDQCRTTLTGEGLLIWWRDNSVRFPLLTRIALRLLPIPASQAASERLFSKMGCIAVDTVPAFSFHIYVQHEDHPTLLAVSFHDRAKCHFLTNFHRPDNVTTRNDDSVPEVVQDDRQHIGSVDRVNRTAAKVFRGSRTTVMFVADGELV